MLKRSREIHFVSVLRDKVFEPLILCSSKLHLYFAGKIVGQIYKSDEGTVRKVTNGISSSFLV